jgi:hypothetical protein
MVGGDIFTSHINLNVKYRRDVEVSYPRHSQPLKKRFIHVASVQISPLDDPSVFRQKYNQ